MRYLKQNTAVTIVVGPLVDYADGKTRLVDNDDFDPANDLLCELVKGNSSSEITLSKTSGDNDCNLTGNGLATLELTASNTNTLGQLRIMLCDASSGGYPTETILPVTEDFMVMTSNVYDSMFSTELLTVDYSAIISALKVEDSWLTASGSGSLTFQQIIKILTACAVGNVVDSGVVGTYDILDPEDDSTIILKVTPSETTPYKDVDIQ